MKNFLEWLSERKEVNLYHGTTAGKDDATLNSFITQGIKPDKAQGYGQGQGFYSYDDLQKAKDHAKSLTGKNAPKSLQQKTGSPMFVTHKATLNPRDYELDKEIQFDDIYRFFVSNEDFINKFFVNGKSIVVKFKDNPHAQFTNDKNIYGFFSHELGLGFYLKNPYAFDFSKVEADDGETNFVIRKVWENKIERGADINEVLKAFIQEIPGFAERYKSFVRAIMKAASEGRTKKPRAWKYVGQKSIRPDELNVTGRPPIKIKKI